jgi:ligand-binding sensor domain-containing protein
VVYPAGAVDSLCEDGHGDIWIGAGKDAALARWERATDRIRDFPKAMGGTIQACATDRTGAVWLAISGHLTRFQGGAFTPFTDATGFPGTGVTGLIVDRRGRLWVTCSPREVFCAATIPPPSIRDSCVTRGSRD